MQLSDAYASVNQPPVKLLQKAHEAVVNGVIYPIHLQLSPTNRCNANCSWCSCSEEDRSLELSLDEITEISSTFKHYGTQAVSITGGGEPTMHPSFNAIVNTFALDGIKVGVTTNGLRPIDNENISWLRISVTKQTTLRHIIGLSANLQNTDIGLSYTVSNDSDVSFAMELVKMANQIKRISHVRFVTDILDPKTSLLEFFKNTINGYKEKCIFQDRSLPMHGSSKCRAGFLKPFIGADGYIYPCCGVQYADKVPSRKMGEKYRLGHWREFPSIEVFDGSKCDRCYLTEYNNVLDLLVRSTRHAEFI